MDHAGFNNKQLLLGIMVYLFLGTCLSLGRAWILKREKIHYFRAEKSLIFTVFSLSDVTDLISQEIKGNDSVALKLMVVAYSHSFNQ